jgi:two-component sensor histidine kinase
MDIPITETEARLLRQQAALASFGSYAFREPVLLKILTEAARVCAEGLGAPFSKICQYRDAENDLLVVAGFGWNDGVVGSVVSQADPTSPGGRAYVTGQPVIIEDLKNAPSFAFPPFYEEHHIVSSVDVIIKGKDGSPFGVLQIDSPVQHTYDQRDVQFLTGFANVLAEAVSTARRIDRMEALVNEKDILAEELKHRVRNNLQLINGMLSNHLTFHTDASENGSVKAIIRRVMALAEVYEQLLGTGLGRTIDFGEYLNSLCKTLPGLQTPGADREIVLTCEADSLLVNLDTVTAMGMVVAELVSNSYDHAADANVAIQVSLRRAATAHEGVLTVADNGAGFVEQAGSKRHGVGLVRRLVEQVRGTAELATDHGASWTIRFPVAAATAAPNRHWSS